MNLNQRIRSEARGRLRNNWGPALGITGILIAGNFVIALLAELGYYLTGLMTSFGMMDLAAAIRAGGIPLAGFFLVPVACAVLALLLLAPLWLGFVRWMSFLARGERLDAEAVFSYYLPANYGAALRFSCAFFLRIAGWAALCLLPGAAFAGVSALAGSGSLSLPAAIVNLFDVLGGTLELGGVILLFNRVLQYFAAPFLFVTRGTVSESIALSVRVMNGYKSSVLRLLLSFLGWALLCVFAFPLIYVLPYITETLLVAAKWIVYNYENYPQTVSSTGFVSQ